MVNILGFYKPKLYHYLAQWNFLEEGKVKCNTDGASKGNSGESAHRFCIRDYKRDLIYA